MDINDIQQKLFQTIKSRISADGSLAEEVATLLDISTDSAYRRMRSEKQITFERLIRFSKSLYSWLQKTSSVVLK